MPPRLAAIACSTTTRTIRSRHPAASSDRIAIGVNVSSATSLVTSIDEKINVWDESFLEDKLQGAKETAEGAGATVTDASTGSVKTNENEFPVITLYAKTADGEDFIMSFMYGTAPIDEENNEYFVFTLTAAAQDEESLQGLLEEFSIE